MCVCVCVFVQLRGRRREDVIAAVMVAVVIITVALASASDPLLVSPGGQQLVSMPAANLTVWKPIFPLACASDPLLVTLYWWPSIGEPRGPTATPYLELINWCKQPIPFSFFSLNLFWRSTHSYNPAAFRAECLYYKQNRQQSDHTYLSTGRGFCQSAPWFGTVKAPSKTALMLPGAQAFVQSGQGHNRLNKISY